MFSSYHPPSFLPLFAGSTNHTKDGSVVRKCRVADKSASVCFSLWNEQAAAIEGGDILKLTKGLGLGLERGSVFLFATVHVCVHLCVFVCLHIACLQVLLTVEGFHGLV